MGKYGNWHSSWDKAIEATDAVRDSLGTDIWDKETGRRWDQGQAICRELFGPDWSNDDRFHEMNTSEICPPEYFEAAERLCRKEPDWLEL